MLALTLALLSNRHAYVMHLVDSTSPLPRYAPLFEDVPLHDALVQVSIVSDGSCQWCTNSLTDWLHMQEWMLRVLYIQIFRWCICFICFSFRVCFYIICSMFLYYMKYASKYRTYFVHSLDDFRCIHWLMQRREVLISFSNGRVTRFSISEGDVPG